MTLGLSERNEPLKHKLIHQGMVFDYKSMGKRVMTMKNTAIPLDIVFIDNKNKIVGIINNIKPFYKEPLTINEDCQYVIEFNGGTVKKLNLKIGDIIKDEDVSIIEELI